MNAQECHPHPVEQADRGRRQKDEEHGGCPGGVGRQGQQRHAHGAHRHDGADREVDAARDHDQRLADADKADHYRELQEVAQVSRRAEAALHEFGADPHREDHDHRQHRPAEEHPFEVHFGFLMAEISGSATAAMMISPCATY
jgi:hypothetical protein